MRQLWLYKYTRTIAFCEALSFNCWNEACGVEVNHLTWHVTVRVHDAKEDDSIFLFSAVNLTEILIATALFNAHLKMHALRCTVMNRQTPVRPSEVGMWDDLFLHAYWTGGKELSMHENVFFAR